MTSFEYLSIFTGWVQLGLIWYGLQIMRESGKRRDQQLDMMAEGMHELMASSRSQREGMEKLLERSA